MQIEDLSRQLNKHTEDDQIFQVEMDKKLDKMLNNHLHHMEIDLAGLNKDVAMLVGIAKFVGTAIGGLLIAAIFAGVIK